MNSERPAACSGRGAVFIRKCSPRLAAHKAAEKLCGARGTQGRQRWRKCILKADTVLEIEYQNHAARSTQKCNFCLLHNFQAAFLEGILFQSRRPGPPMLKYAGKIMRR